MYVVERKSLGNSKV